MALPYKRNEVKDRVRSTWRGMCSVTIPSFMVKMGDEVTVREKSRNNPTILSARDATAHAPAPSWMDVDRDALKGRITGMPKRDELVQIQLNEQLIVELYSK